jgi:hypothetical protein
VETVENEMMKTSEGSVAERPFGQVAAVFLAAGIGSLVLGILTTLAEASGDLKSWLEWSKSVGSLSGKTIIATIVFFVSWAILAAVLRRKDLKHGPVYILTALLVGIGLVLTFPTFFQAFAPAE